MTSSESQKFSQTSETPRMSARRQKAIPRREILSPLHKSYNRLIRLEGQISTVKHILRFLWRYQELPDDNDYAIFTLARDMYFGLIDELMAVFIIPGIDLAEGAINEEALKRMLRQYYFRHFPKDEREREYHWPKIYWFQKLQMILEDEDTSLDQAIVKGWNWFIEAEQYPSKFDDASQYSQFWDQLDNGKKAEFLKSFSVDGAALKTWAASIESTSLQSDLIKDVEARGLKEECRSLGYRLDVDHPWVTVPGRQDYTCCPICRGVLVKEQVDTSAEHRPVQTYCGHIFGYSCLRKAFEESFDCPTCKKELIIPMHQATLEELLESCDRILEWLEPPPAFTNPKEPHSFLDKLALVFKPANEIRYRLQCWALYADNCTAEWGRFSDLGMYLARERMAAVMKDDVQRYREVVLLQAQVAARRVWLKFLGRIIP